MLGVDLSVEKTPSAQTKKLRHCYIVLLKNILYREIVVVIAGWS